MMRLLQYFNLAGMMMVAVFCSFQWRANRSINLKAIELERIRQAQAAKLSEQTDAIKAYLADLEEFRQRVSIAESELKDEQGKVSGLQIERDNLRAEKAAYAAAIDKWRNAIMERDAALKQASAQLISLANERNAAITKFNELVNRYNAAPAEFNGLSGKK